MDRKVLITLEDINMNGTREEQTRGEFLKDIVRGLTLLGYTYKEIADILDYLTGATDEYPEKK